MEYQRKREVSCASCAALLFGERECLWPVKDRGRELLCSEVCKRLMSFGGQGGLRDLGRTLRGAGHTGGAPGKTVEVGVLRAD